MCIIIAKNKGVDYPSKQILKNCFDNNSDGAGYMFLKDNQVHIRKGFMNFEDLYKSLKTLKNAKDLDIVYHFRIGTTASNTPSNTHPYPIYSTVDELHAKKVKCTIGLAHNGILSNFNPTEQEIKTLDINDTQKFILSFLNKIPYRKLHKQKTINKIKSNIATNKLAILDKNGISLIGEFIEENGLYFSNGTYSYSYYDNWYYTYDKTKKSNKTSLYDYDYGYYDYGYYDYDYKDYDNCVDTRFYDNCTNDVFSGYDTYEFKEMSMLNYMHSLNDSELQPLLPLTLQGTKHLRDFDYDGVMYFYDSKIDVYYEYDLISDTVSTLDIF